MQLVDGDEHAMVVVNGGVYGRRQDFSYQECKEKSSF